MMRMRNLFAAMVFAVIASVVIVAPAAAYGASDDVLAAASVAAYEPTDDAAESMSNDALFAAYVNQQFARANDELSGDVSLETMAASSARDQLDALGKAVYDILLPKVKAVAAGEQTSTEFSGMLTSVSSPNDVLDAIGRAMDALMEDCPYELYWYDKTTPANRVSNGRSFNVSFAVSADYSATGATGSTTTRSDLSRVKTAANKAAAIVANHKGENDCAKLDSYRSEICNLVSYNDSAANGYYGHYGDPWQLVWVFDGDSSTSVVCEGYAKAFKYLCDLSTFKNSSIACYTVEGTMVSNSYSGGHMWNIVTVDGKSYLADITNCDAGSVGSALQASDTAPGRYLFMKGYSAAISNGYRINIPYKEVSTSSGKRWVDATSVSYTYDSNASSILGASVLKLSDADWKVSAKKFSVAKVADKKYTGKAIKPKPVVKYQGTKLKLGTDYTLAYKKNKNVGTAKIVIKGTGFYTGKKTVAFKIVKA